MVIAVLLAASCTAGQPQTDSSTSALSPAGTAYPLPSVSAPLSTRASAATNAVTSPSSSVAQPSVGATLTTVPVTSGTRSTPSTNPPGTTAQPTRPTPTTRPSASTPSVTATADATPTVDTAGLSASEIADREAIESVWVRYWQNVASIVRTPKNARLTKMTAVAVPKQAQSVVDEATQFQSKGWDNYGVVEHRFYWGPSVGGADVAIMGDCMNGSHAGRKDVKTGQLLTVGVSRDNARGIFDRGSDGKWRVSGIQYLTDQKC